MVALSAGHTATPAPALRRRRARVASWLWACLLCVCGAIHAVDAPATTAPKEYVVKAAFLFNFSKFVEWPQTAFARPEEPLRIGVLGVDPFGAALDQLVRGEHVRGRPITVQRARRVEDLAGCHVLFVSRSESGSVAHTLEQVRGQSMLTVSDVPGFVDAGGGIEFRIENNRVRFLINQPDTLARGLKLSAQLLSLAMAPPEPRR